MIIFLERFLWKEKFISLERENDQKKKKSIKFILHDQNLTLLHLNLT